MHYPPSFARLLDAASTNNGRIETFFGLADFIRDLTSAPQRIRLVPEMIVKTSLATMAKWRVAKPRVAVALNSRSKI
jgi:hypothetical protein